MLVRRSWSRRLADWKLLAQKTRRRWLTRLQLWWLVHLGSRPHTCSTEPVMVIAPHQDDEVLGCGGLIALKRQARVPVQIVFMTDGAASHDQLTGRNPALVAIRRQEALRAAAILGVDERDVHFLDLPDGQLRSLPASERERAVESLTQLLMQTQPQELFVPHRHDRTDDHEATYELAMAAVQASHEPVTVFEYAVWMLWSSLIFRDFGVEELQGAKRLLIRTVCEQKRKALLAHRSQWMRSGQQSEPVLEPGFLDRFCQPYEVYFRPAAPRALTHMSSRT